MYPIQPDEPDPAATALIRKSLADAVACGASDLHVVAGHAPTMRLHGKLKELPTGTLDDETIDAALTALCPPLAFKRFKGAKNLDFALELEVDGRPQRFRASYFVSGSQ